MKHTPGPWRVTGGCIRSDDHVDGTGALLLEAGSMFHNYTPDKEEIAANLRLAAAAPALLEAAQAMIDYWLTGGAGAGDPDGPLPSKVEGRAIAALRAAIAAATGGVA
jgi:hypothetical protein